MKKQIIVTVESMEKAGACPEGLAWLKARHEDGVKELGALVRAAVEEDGLDAVRFANWGLARVLSRRGCVLYAINAARLALPEFEKRFPADDRPRKAVEAAEKWAADPTPENAAAAARAAAEAAAAYAAYAARAACAAAHAAYAAARAAEAAEAAEAAAYAADAAEAAAYASYAAEAAAYAAAEKKTLARLLRYGVKVAYEEAA